MIYGGYYGKKIFKKIGCLEKCNDAHSCGHYLFLALHFFFLGNAHLLFRQNFSFGNMPSFHTLGKSKGGLYE
jgi:hypothetical protein